jgi:hypothetical protein
MSTQQSCLRPAGKTRAHARASLFRVRWLTDTSRTQPPALRWRAREGALYVGDERRAFAAYVFEKVALKVKEAASR